MQLAEKWRPRTWDDFYGHEDLKKKVFHLRKSGRLGGRAYFISGPSGCGKSSAAWLIGAELCEPFFIEEMDARELTTGRIREIKRELHYPALGDKKGKCWIISEAHGLTKDSCRQLLTLIDSPSEPLPDWAVFVFTTTIAGQLTFEDMDDSSPLLSRCVRLELDRRGWVTAGKGVPGPAVERLMQIADAENLNGKPAEAYIKLLQGLNGNLRAAIQAVDAGEMLK